MKTHHPSHPKRLFSMGLACICAAAAVTAASPLTAAAQDSKQYALADNIQDGVILHCFDWSYNAVRDELANIAAAGFSTVQLSPVQATDYPGMEQGTANWAMLYQPTGFHVAENGMLGTKDELRELCTEADAYGIKIITDVVANHLTGDRDVIDPEMLQDDYWRDAHEIDYTRRESITTGKLTGSLDINTENPEVQKKILNYLNELKELGVDGVRWDAAKHIALPSEGSDFWEKVTATDLYHYGEILGGPGGESINVKPLMREYARLMSVTDSSYGDSLRACFTSGRALGMDGNWTDSNIPASSLVYWGESHDTYTHTLSDDAYVNRTPQNAVDRAYAVAAAREGATALYLSRPFGSTRYVMFAGEKGSTHFTSPEVAAVNHFHNAMIGKPDSYAVTDNCAVITRQGGGAVLVCGSGCGTVSVANAGSYAAPGVYYDEVTGNRFEVTADTITGEVGSTGIAVLIDNKTVSRISADLGSGSWAGYQHVSLNVLNATDAHYVLTEAYHQPGTDKLSDPVVTEGDFQNGDFVTVGKSDRPGVATLALSATAADGTKLSETYTYLVFGQFFKAPEPEQSTVALCLDSVSYDWHLKGSVACLVYDDDDPDAEPEKIAMTYDSDSFYYTCTLPESLRGKNNLRPEFVNADGKAVKQGYNGTFCMRYADSAAYRMETWTTYDVHTHSTGAAWQSDDNDHWHVCADCGAVLDRAAHTPSDWIVDTEASEDAPGARHRECTVCGKILAAEEIAQLTAETTEPTTEEPTQPEESRDTEKATDDPGETEPQQTTAPAADGSQSDDPTQPDGSSYDGSDPSGGTDSTPVQTGSALPTAAALALLVLGCTLLGAAFFVRRSR